MGARRGGGAGRPSPFAMTLAQTESVLQSQFRNWLRADSLASTSLQDKINAAHTMAPTGTIAASTPAALNGQAARTMAGAGVYVSSLAPSAWDGMYNGSGCTAIQLFNPGVNTTGVMVNTINNGATPGAALSVFNAATFNMNVYNASGVAFSASGVGSYTNNTATYLVNQIASASVVFKQKQAPIASGSLASPAASGGLQTLRIGNQQPGSFGWSGDFADFLYAPSVVSAYVLQVFAQYALLRYGVPL